MDHCRILYFVTDLSPAFVPAFMLDRQALGQMAEQGGQGSQTQHRRNKDVPFERLEAVVENLDRCQFS